LKLALSLQARPGRIEKQIRLRSGHAAVYCRHTIHGAAGPMSMGHHAMLKFPTAPGSGRISTSDFVHGQVYPERFEEPEAGGYDALQPGATFDSLDRVPLREGGWSDLSQFPARHGYEDLVQVFADANQPWAWTAVTFPSQQYVWFALKDPRVLASTVMWFSNGGRHYAPWHGRHGPVVGLEEVTGYFHTGLASSATSNSLSQRGLPTAITLDPHKPTTVNYIMAVAAIPQTFDRVRHIEATDQGMTLYANSGEMVTTPLDLDWLQTSQPPA
jgi:hypothetical protein